MLGIHVAVDAQDVVDALVRSRDEDAVFDMIVDLDSMWGDWDFTERLYKHFKTLHADYKEEKKYLRELFK